MDQNSRAPANLVISLLQTFGKYNNAGIVSPRHSNRFDTHLNYKDEIEKVNSIMTSGNLLSLSVYEKVGPFGKNYL